jgi:hypothetical protein
MANLAGVPVLLYRLHYTAEGLARMSPAQYDDKDVRALVAIDYLFESMFNTLTKED